MKKILVMIFTLLLTLTISGCNLLENDKYAEYAGTYELYEASGAISMSSFDYYRIILKADGTCVIESKASMNSQEYHADATFDIADGKIKIYSKSGSTTVTETYDYVNGEIHMLNQNLGGYTINAKFRRNTNVEAE